MKQTQHLLCHDLHHIEQHQHRGAGDAGVVYRHGNGKVGSGLGQAVFGEADAVDNQKEKEGAQHQIDDQLHRRPEPDRDGGEHHIHVQVPFFPDTPGGSPEYQIGKGQAQHVLAPGERRLEHISKQDLGEGDHQHRNGADAHHQLGAAVHHEIQ